MPERKIEYEKLDHKADIGFRVRAPSWERLYIDAGLAMTDIIAKLERIEPKERRSATATGDTREDLMVRWLNELLFLFEKEKFISRRIVFDKFDGKTIKATLTGEKYEPARHGGTSEIKSATYHQLKLGDASTPEPHFFAQVFLDL